MYRSPFSCDSQAFISLEKEKKKKRCYSLTHQSIPDITVNLMEKNGGWSKKKLKVKILTLTSILQGLLNFWILWLRQKQNKQQQKGNKTGGNILLKHHDWLPSQMDSSCWSSVDGKVATHQFPSTFCAGHAWHSPGTAPPCPARCALPTLPPDTK